MHLTFSTFLEIFDANWSILSRQKRSGFYVSSIRGVHTWSHCEHDCKSKWAWLYTLELIPEGACIFVGGFNRDHIILHVPRKIISCLPSYRWLFRDTGISLGCRFIMLKCSTTTAQLLNYSLRPTSERNKTVCKVPSIFFPHWATTFWNQFFASRPVGIIRFRGQVFILRLGSFTYLFEGIA